MFSAGRKGRKGVHFFIFLTRSTSSGTGLSSRSTSSGSGPGSGSGSISSSWRKSVAAAASFSSSCAPLPCIAAALKSTGTVPGPCTSSSSSRPKGKRRSSAASSPSPCPASTSSPSSSKLPNPNDLLHTFAQLGFSEQSLSRFSSSPSSLAILQLLLSSGVSPAHIKRQSGRRCFQRIFTLPLCDVSAKIDLLGPALLSSHPPLLELGVATLRPKVEFFQNLGLRLEKMASFGRVFKVKLEALEQRVSYLRYLGLSPECLSVALRRYPYILCVSVERTMKPAVEFLEKECELPRKTICRFVTARPCIISLSRSNLLQKVQFFKSLGIDTRCPQFYTALVELANLSSIRLQARLDWLMSQGVAREEVVRLILRAPFVLTCSEANIGGKFEYLLVESNRGILEILHYPVVLALSLERRIKPRFAVMARLQERALLKDSPSLAVILGPSDETFRRRYIDKFQDDLAP